MRLKPRTGDMDRVSPHCRSGDKFNQRNEARREHNRPHVRTVTEFQDGSHGIHEDRRVEMIDVMVIGGMSIAKEKAEVQRHRQYDRKGVNNFLEVHISTFRMRL
jgi:hypothetical protein